LTWDTTTTWEEGDDFVLMEVLPERRVVPPTYPTGALAQLEARQARTPTPPVVQPGDPVVMPHEVAELGAILRDVRKERLGVKTVTAVQPGDPVFTPPLAQDVALLNDALTAALNARHGSTHNAPNTVMDVIVRQVLKEQCGSIGESMHALVIAHARAAGPLEVEAAYAAENPTILQVCLRRVWDAFKQSPSTSDETGA
jgi:hypothetical protein